VDFDQAFVRLALKHGHRIVDGATTGSHDERDHLRDRRLRGLECWLVHGFPRCRECAQAATEAGNLACVINSPMSASRGRSSKAWRRPAWGGSSRMPEQQASNLAQYCSRAKGAALLPSGMAITSLSLCPFFSVMCTSVGNSPSSLSTGWRWMSGNSDRTSSAKIFSGVKSARVQSPRASTQPTAYSAENLAS